MGELHLRAEVRAAVEDAAQRRRPLIVGGVEWAVSKGKRRENGRAHRAGFFHPWHLANAELGISVGLAPDRARVEYSYWPLWERAVAGGEPCAGTWSAWRWVRDWITTALHDGPAPPKFAVTRLDLAADFTGWADLGRADLDRFTCRARERGLDLHDKGGLTFRFGALPPRAARVYVKSAELEVSNKQVFWRIWDLEPDSETVVRVEFRWGTGGKGNPLRSTLGTSNPETVLSPAGLDRLWQVTAGSVGTRNGWLWLATTAGGSVLDPLWDDVRRVSWRWEDRGCEAGSALPAPPHPAPALDPTPAIQSLYGGLKWFARTSGAAGLTDALTRAIPHLLAEQARQGAPFGEQVRADALQKGGHAAPIDAGGDGPDPFAAAMAQIRTSDGTAGLPATPSDVAEELRRELTVLAALLAAAGEGRPWTAAFQRLYREADALCPFRLYAQPDGSQRLGRHAADPWAYARLVALLKMPIVITDFERDVSDPYAVFGGNSSPLARP